MKRSGNKKTFFRVLAVGIIAAAAGLGSFVEFRDRPSVGVDHFANSDLTDVTSAAPSRRAARFAHHTPPPAAAGAGGNSAPPDPAAYNVAVTLRAPPWQLYNAEMRHPVWAPKMEGLLQQRFRPEAMASVPGLAVNDIECRISSCRVEYSLTADELQNLPESERETALIKKLNLFSMRNGPIGPITTLAPSSSWESKHLIVLFDKDAIDPSGYMSWLDRYLERQRTSGRKRAVTP